MEKRRPFSKCRQQAACDCRGKEPSVQGGKRREGTLGFVELGPCAPLLAPNLHSGILVYSD